MITVIHMWRTVSVPLARLTAIGRLALAAA
jgi:hypothetical protein